MIILGTNSIKDTGFDVANSLRFNAGSSDSLTKTFGTPTNNKIWTYSFWMKHCDNSGVLLNTGADTSYMYFRGSSANPTPFGFSIEQYVGGFQYKFIPNQVFRDHSAWQHIVIAFDTTQGTASNRVKIYKNGVQITSFGSADYPSQNLDTQVNSAVAHKIGGHGSSGFYDGYLCEVVFIDGQQLAPDQFGEFDSDSGIWKPIDVSGLTFGNNGFYLDFENSGALGADVSGNSNNFTVNNLTAIDQSTDTCTNNFATLNPLAPMDTSAPVQTLSEGNLKAVPSSGWNPAYATIPLSSGKWYIEVLVTQVSGNEVVIGLNPDNFSNTSDTAHSHSGSGVWYQSNGLKWVSGSNSSYGASYDDGDIISVLINMDDGEVTFYKNDSSQGTISFNTNLTGASSIIFGLNGIETTSITQTNFGSPPYAVSSSNTDGNGYGNFEFATKGGYALNTKNLSEFG